MHQSIGDMVWRLLMGHSSLFCFLPDVLRVDNAKGVQSVELASRSCYEPGNRHNRGETIVSLDCKLCSHLPHGGTKLPKLLDNMSGNVAMVLLA